jgi:hypothetical protein
MLPIPFGISNLVCKVSLISLTDFTVGCCITDTICVCFSTITTVGSVSIETSPPSVVIKTTKDKQTQIVSVMQHPTVKSVNDIKLTLHTKFDIPKGIGIVVLITTDGGLVSIDTDPNVVIVENISCIFVLMFYLKLSCCRLPS